MSNKEQASVKGFMKFVADKVCDNPFERIDHYEWASCAIGEYAKHVGSPLKSGKYDVLDEKENDYKNGFFEFLQELNSKDKFLDCSYGKYCEAVDYEDLFIALLYLHPLKNKKYSA